VNNLSVFLNPSQDLHRITLVLMEGGAVLESMEMGNRYFDLLCEHLIGLIRRLEVEDGRVFVPPYGAGRALIEEMGKRGLAVSAVQGYPHLRNIDWEIVQEIWKKEPGHGQD
jgi:hypothetical protein